MSTSSPAALSEPVRCNWTPYGMVPANGGAWVQHQAAASEPAAPLDARDALTDKQINAWLSEAQSYDGTTITDWVRACIDAAIARQAAAPAIPNLGEPS